MFNLFKKAEVAQAKPKFVLIEKETETLFGYFESHNEVLEQKIVLELQHQRACRIENV